MKHAYLMYFVFYLLGSFFGIQRLLSIVGVKAG